jgi:hypothetical protein
MPGGLLHAGAGSRLAHGGGYPQWGKHWAAWPPCAGRMLVMRLADEIVKGYDFPRRSP